MTCAISSELNSPPSRFFSISDGRCMIKTRSDEIQRLLNFRFIITPLSRRLESDRMPRGFHFNSIKNPIWIFPVPNEVICDVAPDVTLEVDGGAGLQCLTDLVVAAGIDNCVDVHVTCEMRRELVAITCKKIENTRRKVTRRDDFGKGERGQRIRRRSERDDAIAAGNDGSDNRYQSEQGRRIRRQRQHHASWFRDREIEMRGRYGIYRSENLRKLVRPTGVINQAINRGRYLVARPSPRAVNAPKLAF